jgi:hypothetical protein
MTAGRAALGDNPTHVAQRATRLAEPRLRHPGPLPTEAAGNERPAP